MLPFRSFRHSISRGVSSISQILFGGNKENQILEAKYLRVMGSLLALGSGLCLTLYSFLYKTITDEIARSTVLCTRGLIQVIQAEQKYQ